MGALLHAPTQEIFSFGSLVLVVAVAVFRDIHLKLRAEGLEKEESDEAGSGDLAGASAKDLGDRIDDSNKGDEGENDDEHHDGAEGFHCSFLSEVGDVLGEIETEDGRGGNRDEVRIRSDR